MVMVGLARGCCLFCCCSVFSEKDNVMYDVWMFEDQVSFMSCNFSGDNVLTGPNPTYQVRIQDVRLQPMSPNSNNTVYFGSSDLDTRKNCENGMRFSVVYYTCQSCKSPPTSKLAQLAAYS